MGSTDRALRWVGVGVVALVACGGDDAPASAPASSLVDEMGSLMPSDAPAPAARAPASPAPEPAPAPAPVPPATPVPRSTELSEAVVRIVVQGTFVDPFDLQAYSGVGSGSGFIIDPSGIVVTNNHVVANGTIVDVYIGERPEPVAAEVLGVSECNDVAVLDLVGEGYQYLDWFTQPVTRGLSVRAVGYPLDTPLLTLTEGIVASSEAPLDTDWASVSAMLQHDARINPGNSGGPLITTTDVPAVVGINYAGNDSTDQNFAISVTAARALVERLRTGVDVDSIGINGRAFLYGPTSVIGVYSVAPGSPAERTGLRAGDLIRSFGDRAPAPLATMADYCGILRTQGQQGVIPLQVLRGGTEVLAGQVNGTPLAAVVTLPSGPAGGCTDLCVRSTEVANGICSDGSAGGTLLCDAGTDCADCGDGPAGCTDVCTVASFAGDGACDDAGPDADFTVCDFGTDCTDCGSRGTDPAPLGLCLDLCSATAGPAIDNGVCNDGRGDDDDDVFCDLGTDCTDCGDSDEGCTDSCTALASVGNGTCEDIGENPFCDRGTDCADCGPR